MQVASGRLSVLLFAIAVALLPGCNGSSPTGVPAKGTVMVDEQPLSGAVITLEPIRGTVGPNASSPILDGQFEFTPEAGLVGGTYRVRISMIPAEIRGSLPPEHRASMPPDDAMIDPEYDGNSLIDCKLEPGQENLLEFSVKFL